MPVVYRWAYDYGVPGAKEDFIPQNQPPDPRIPAGREHGVNPMDPGMRIGWRPTEEAGEPILSDKDLAAPSLDEALRAGQLPQYADCVAYGDKLRG